MSNYRVHVKHLKEENSIDSVLGELIVSQVSGHISVKGYNGIVSATKELEARLDGCSKTVDILVEVNNILNLNTILYPIPSYISNKLNLKEGLAGIRDFLYIQDEGILDRIDKIKIFSEYIENSIYNLNSIKEQMSTYIEICNRHSTTIKNMKKIFYNEVVPSISDINQFIIECEEYCTENKIYVELISEIVGGFNTEYAFNFNSDIDELLNQLESRYNEIGKYYDSNSSESLVSEREHLERINEIINGIDSDVFDVSSKGSYSLYPNSYPYKGY